MVAPFDQVFPVALDEVRTTDPPEQKVIAPPALIVGAVGEGFTTTTVGEELEVQVPLETTTEYDPPCVTVID